MSLGCPPTLPDNRRQPPTRLVGPRQAASLGHLSEDDVETLVKFARRGADHARRRSGSRLPAPLDGLFRLPESRAKRRREWRFALPEDGQPGA